MKSATQAGKRRRESCAPRRNPLQEVGVGADFECEAEAQPPR